MEPENYFAKINQRGEIGNCHMNNNNNIKPFLPNYLEKEFVLEMSSCESTQCAQKCASAKTTETTEGRPRVYFDISIGGDEGMYGL